MIVACSVQLLMKMRAPTVVDRKSLNFFNKVEEKSVGLFAVIAIAVATAFRRVGPVATGGFGLDVAQAVVLKHHHRAIYVASSIVGI